MGGRGKKGRKVKGQNGVVYWERRRKCVKRNEGTWLATRKKNIIFSPEIKIGGDLGLSTAIFFYFTF